MALFIGFLSTMDLFRSIYGPLPDSLCVFIVFMKNIIQLNVSQLSMMLTVTKFAFVCIYKSIPSMNDNFLSIYIYMSINMVSFLTTLSRKYLPGRPILLEVKKIECFSKLSARSAPSYSAFVWCNWGKIVKMGASEASH